MKNTIIKCFFKVLCLTLISLTTLTTLHAQRYDHLSKSEKESKSLELINQADYIVEGVVKGHEFFYGEDEKTIYTAYTVEVAHWYKGKGNNTIQLIKKGGFIGMDFQIITHDPTPSIAVGPRYIFLLRESFKKGGYEFLDNEAIAKYRYMTTDRSYIAGFYGVIFNSDEDSKNFFSKANKIKLPRKKKDVTFQKSSANPPINITSISPSTIRAGTGEILTIRGTGFGPTAGNVLFRDADKPISSDDGSDLYLLGLDDFYIVNWIQGVGGADDVILVKVPSNIFESGPVGHGAGSGSIIIERADNTKSDPSNQILTVEYSLTNLGLYSTSGQDTLPMTSTLIAREHCLNGFVFTLHNSFSGEQPDKVNARASIEAALVSWRNALGDKITLQLEKKINGAYQYVDFKKDPDNFRAVISFDSLATHVGMQTPYSPQYDYCNGSCYPAVYRFHGGGIQVNSQKQWYYNHTGNVPAGKLDFYTAMLHELGHYIGVGHNIVLKDGNTIDDKNLMAYSPHFLGAISEPDRVTLTNYNSRAVDAAKNIIDSSKVHVWSDDFTNRFGIETLSDVNSTVQPTPKINPSQIFPEDGPIYGNPKIFLKPNPFNPAYDYYWWWANPTTGNTIADQMNNVSVCSTTDYWVRIKNPSCSVSSLYSLPELFKLPGCIKTGSWRDGNLIVSPNPTSGHIDISFDSFEDERSIENTYIGIYDNLGGLQIERRVEDANSRRSTINISELPAGTYWVVWFSGSGEVIATEQVQKVN